MEQKELDMNEINDEVIKQAAAGDVGAFEMVYQAYFSLVSNVAFRVVNNREDAQDIVQEVFIKMYDQLKNFRFDSSLKTWIYRITVNTAINYGKKTNKFQHQPLEFADGVIAKNEGIDVDKEYNEKIVSSLLQSLNPDQRTCVILRNIENCSYEEIAKTLNIPINTVRSRLKRARETMLAIKNEVMNNEM